MKRKTPTIDKQLHPAHVAILRVLLFRPEARFAELQKEAGLSSDHFNFYLQQLLDEAYIEKNDTGAYHLTFKGKEFSNRFDTDARVVERQPKVAVCLFIYGDDGRELIQQRLKQPFYGYWARPTGKIRWGETILDAAARELMEETGLEADLTFDFVYHKMDYDRKKGSMLEDKIFFMIRCEHPRGALIEAFEGGRNQWMAPSEFDTLELSFIATQAEAKQMNDAAPKVSIIEVRHEYDPEQY